MRGGVGGGDSRSVFSFVTFVGLFPSDRAASMAVKGLILGSAALLTMDEDRFSAE